MAEATLMTAVGAFSAVTKGLQSLKDLATSGDAQAKISDLYGIIISGQAIAFEDNLKQRALLETIEELKDQIRAMEAWDSEKQRYQLARPWMGAVVYALKKSASNNEPPHWICTNCYNDGKKSLLNYTPTASRADKQTLICRCKTIVASPHHLADDMKYAEDMTLPA